MEDIIRKYEHVIVRAMQEIELHDLGELHCQNMVVFSQERQGRRENVQVSLKL